MQAFAGVLNRYLIVLGCCAMLLACAGPAYAQAALNLSSPAFTPGGAIPKQYSCEGEDYSPALTWTDVPQSAKTLALIVDDPDAPRGTFVHWVVYNLPASVRHLDENVAKEPTIAGGGNQGRNGFRRFGYGGPCPPPGPTHHYHFRLYALDSSLNMGPGATAAQVQAAIQGHVLATAELVGIYKR